jgi:hypothetical protein
MPFRCATCGATHDELPFCFISRAPAQTSVVPEAELPTRVLLSTDQCVIDGEHFFILGNLDLPILGRDETFRWSLWSSLSRTSFERANELWEAEGREREPPYFGWLSTAIPGYERTVGLKVNVLTQPVGVRPLIRLLPQEHPLAHDQFEGISWERACELSHASA